MNDRKRNFFSWLIRKYGRGILFGFLAISGAFIAYWFKISRPPFYLLIVWLIGYYFINIKGFFKYNLFWDFKLKLIEFTLQPIWERAGIIEIRGGAQTGKTLCLMLLTKHLKGRKWNNIPNANPGCQLLTLQTLKDVREGNFKQGLVGFHNVLLIDEIWEFFSKKEINQAKTQTSLSNLLWWLSETSKTNWKIFYTTKQGISLKKELFILTANKTAVITTTKPRFYCRWWGKNYYFLDIKFEKKKISIPYTDDDLYLFDNTWNCDPDYAMNKLKSFVRETKADKLTRMLKIEKSRTEQIREENEAEKWGRKKYPDMFYKEKFWETMKKKGHKSIKQLAEESGVTKEEVNLEKIKLEVDEKHRRGSGKWNQIFDYKVSLARIELSERRAKGQVEEEEEKEEENIPLEENQQGEIIKKTEKEVDMDIIYKKVSKKYLRGSPKWERAVEKEISLFHKKKPEEGTEEISQ